MVLIIRETWRRPFARPSATKFDGRIAVTTPTSATRSRPGLVPPTPRANRGAPPTPRSPPSRWKNRSPSSTPTIFTGASSYRVLAGYLRRPQVGPVPEVRDRRLPSRHDTEPRRPGEPRRLHGRRGRLPRLDPRGPEGRAGRRGRTRARRVRRGAADSRLDARLAQLLGLRPRAPAGARAGLPPVPRGERRQREGRVLPEHGRPVARGRRPRARARPRRRRPVGRAATYPGDRPRLVELLASLTARGEYPRDLWA